jgi:hypothetical protein
MSQFNSREESANAPTTMTSPVGMHSIPSPLQSPALEAILDKSGLNPATAFDNHTPYDFEAAPWDIFKDIAFDDEPFNQLFRDGATAGIDGTSESFVSRFGSSS